MSVASSDEEETATSSHKTPHVDPVRGLRGLWLDYVRRTMDYVRNDPFLQEGSSTGDREDHVASGVQKRGRRTSLAHGGTQRGAGQRVPRPQVQQSHGVCGPKVGVVVEGVL